MLPTIQRVNKVQRAVNVSSKSQVRNFHISNINSDLDANTIKIIKSTAPVLAEHGYEITKTMYKNMFKNHPDIKTLFNQSHQLEIDGKKANQPSVLAASVHAYASNIDNLGVLGAAVERIAQKHVSLNILPEQYPIVGTELLNAIKEVLGDNATPEIMEAWKNGYFFLADILIEREKKIKNESLEKTGGWEGWREFEIFKKEKESSEITSFYFKPVDGKNITPWKAGQFIGIRIGNENGETQRNYTLSCAPNSEYYRISLKHHSNPEHLGEVSHKLVTSYEIGDKVSFSVPCGDFYFDEKLHSEKPLVLVSGGVGITPMISIIEHMNKNSLKNPIFLLTGYRNKSVEPWHDYLDQLSKKNINFNVHHVYSDENVTDYPTGHVTIEHIKQVAPVKDSIFFICGPPEFMENSIQGLKSENVDITNINYESFGFSLN